MKPRLTGVLLAGGRGTRMGLDKATLEFEGEPLVERALRVLRAACDGVLVASGDGRRLGQLGEPQVADAIADAGPLGGIVAALEIAETELVAVLAVDMPFANPKVFRLLADSWRTEDATVPVTDRGPEPLHAIYATTSAPRLRAMLESGERAVRRAVEALDVRLVGQDEWREADPAGRFAFNVNRPEDLAAGGTS